MLVVKIQTKQESVNKKSLSPCLIGKISVLMDVMRVGVFVCRCVYNSA